ncbi:hypothetical protein BC941DRAFT_477433 [Chlamydoabsidia padenii]|nr:hypothetical protein BC941DRAFT_477433 [Chlamydoabsidia padenii]
MVLEDAFPRGDLDNFRKFVVKTIASILDLPEDRRYYADLGVAGRFGSCISEQRSALVDRIKKFLLSYDFDTGSLPKKEYLAYIADNGRFAREDALDDSPLFTGDLFLECFYKVLCLKHGQTPPIPAEHINKQSIGLVFTIMLLKLSVMSGDMTCLEFKESGSNP